MKKRLKSIIIALIFSAVSIYQLKAQTDELNCIEFSTYIAENLYQQALSREAFNLLESLRLLKQAIEVYPEYVPAYYKMAKINYKLAQKYEKDIYLEQKAPKRYDNFENNLLYVINKEPSYNNYLAFYFLGTYYYEKKNYEKSNDYLNLFVEKNQIHCSEIELSQAYLKNINQYFEWLNNPVLFNPLSIDSVNTQADEFLPLISPDGSKIFFTRRLDKRSRHTSKPTKADKFMVSKKTSKKTDTIELYADAQVMPMPFNDGRDQGGVSITIDNNHLFITICEFVRMGSTSYKNCDIFSSDFDGEKWSRPQRLSRNINGRGTWEGQPTVTSDGKVLYFASARPEDNYGGLDIYMSKKDEDEKWGKAENLGPMINTPLNEKTPFIHTDSETLYFSSDGRFGLGGFDIFYSQFIKGKWTEPQNLGYPINTQDDEVAFIVSTNGEKIYFSSTKHDGRGGWDIYASDLYELARPQKVLLVNGQIYNEEGEALKNAQVELQSLKTLKLTKGLVDPETGHYAIALAVIENDELILTVKKEGMFFSSEYITPTKDDLQNPPKTVNIEVKKIREGTVIKLNNIYFEINSAHLNEKSKISLDNFVEFLTINPAVKITLYGHTDNIGDEQSNYVLSKKRAKAVRDYLINKGIKANRVDYKGFGEEKPIASNDTPEGRAKNRRTEFVVTVK